MPLLLNSVYGRGLKHAERGPHLAREGIFVRPAILFGNLEIINI